MKKIDVREKRYKRDRVLIFFLVVIPMVLCTVEVITQFFMYGLVKNMIDEGRISVENVTEISIMDTIMSLISIAVSVWIGLNIYNIYNKNDVETAVETVDIAINEVLYESQKRKFIWQLEKGEYMYEICEYFCKKFEKIDDIPFDILERITEFEKRFFHCYNAYEKGRRQESVNIAKNLLEKIYALREDAEEIIKNKEQCKVLWTYFNIREADVIFYNNQNLVLTDDVVKMYTNSIELYETELKNIPDSNKELQGYMQNSIGYTYKLISSIDKKYIESAKMYMSYAIQRNPKGRYFQNLGSLYEKTDEYDKALECYAQALSAPKRDDKIYNLIGSLKLKIVDSKLNIHCRFKDRKALIDIANEAKIRLDIEDIGKLIIDAYEWLNFGMSIKEPVKDTYYNCSKACIYYYLFVKKDKDKMKEAKKYLKIFDVFSDMMGNTESQPIGYLFTLRNFYEAKKEYNEALEVNQKIKDILGEDGSKKADVLEAEEVYVSR